MPFSVGRMVLHYISKLFVSATTPLLSNAVSVIAGSSINTTWNDGLTTAANLSTENKSHLVDVFAQTLKENLTALGELSNSIRSSSSVDLIKGAFVGSSNLSDLTTLATGYIFISSLVFFYLGVVALIRYSRGDPFTVGRLYGIATIAEAIPSLARQFVAAMRHLMTMIKVAFLLVIELGVFPLMCGWWLDICTIRMLGKTIPQRVEFFSSSPLASSLIHWIIGIVYMLQISIFVSLLRGVC